MNTSSDRDLVAACALILSGLAFGFYAIIQLRLGTFAQMGPGMFPFLVGLTVAMLGAALLVTTALKRRRAQTPVDAAALQAPDWRTLALVVFSIAVFALLIRRAGMVPAVFAMVLVASRSSDDLRPLKALALAAVLCVIGWVVFVLLLGLPIPLLAWSF